MKKKPVKPPKKNANRTRPKSEAFATLVDALRRSFLYQTPQPIFAKPDDEQPTQVVLKMPFGLYGRMMHIINEAGGWVLPPTEKSRLLAQHELQARRAIGDGITYDFTGMSHGDLLYMHAETKGIDELAPFHAAIEEELKRQSEAMREGEVARDDA